MLSKILGARSPQELPEDYKQVRPLQNLFTMPRVRLAMPECAALDIDPGHVLDTTTSLKISYFAITNLRYATATDTLQGLIEKHGEDIFFYDLADVVATIGAKIINTEGQSGSAQAYPHKGYDMRDAGKSYFLYRDGPAVWAICVHGPRRPGIVDAPYLDWYDQVRAGCWYIEMYPAKEVEFTSRDQIYRPVKVEQSSAHMKKPVIDCDAKSSIEYGSIWEHAKGGMFAWSHKNVGLYQSKAEHSYLGRYIIGYDLISELREKGVPALNACVLDFLLDHQDHVPEAWKGKKIWFPGTIYNFYPSYSGTIAGLYWDSTYHCWKRELRSLGTAFTGNSYIATNDSILL